MRNNTSYDTGEKAEDFTAFALANYCIPTLLKVKPSSLMNINKSNIPKGINFLEKMENEMMQFDSCYSVLYEDTARYLVLVYSKELLSHVLHYEENRMFLESLGYQFAANYEQTSIHLLAQNYMEYIRSRKGFPHEIGVFLGYPLKDVKDFIKNSGRNYIICGCWKVYHDAEQAVKVFELFRQLREDAVQILQEGKELKEIITVYSKNSKHLSSYS